MQNVAIQSSASAVALADLANHAATTAAPAIRDLLPVEIMLIGGGECLVNGL